MKAASPYKVTTLANGVRVATAWMPHLRGANVGVWVEVGCRHERKSEGGVAHFLEHLLFKGTSAHSARELTCAVEGVGGYLNAFTTEDHTCYYAKADAAHFGRLSEVLLEMYLDSQFPEHEVERERGVIQEEISSLRDVPSQWAEDLLAESLWPGHPLGRPLTGTQESVGRISRVDLQRFRQRHYTGRNTIFTVAGPVLHEDVLRQVRRPLEGLPRGVASRPLLAREEAACVRVENEDTEQAHFALGFHSCSRTAPERFALRLLSVMLGENMSSRLFQSLRERYGYCYSAQSSVVGLLEAGALCVYTDLDPAKLEKAVAAIRRECARFSVREPSRGDLRMAAQYAIGQTRVALDSATQQAGWMAESLMAVGRVVELEEAERAVLGVTPAAVHAVARKCLQFGGAAAALVGPGVPVSRLAKMVRGAAL
ncbi:MAG: putative Zn-dependent peptidase [Verrucomicrobia bacterium]|nr:MAG: putative Zn-dependent peptidase [Verrucomicrobiota bacterium]